MIVANRDEASCSINTISRRRLNTFVPPLPHKGSRGIVPALVVDVIVTLTVESTMVGMHLNHLPWIEFVFAPPIPPRAWGAVEYYRSMHPPTSSVG